MDSQTSLVWCDVCGRLLDAEESRQRGRGPICDARRNPRAPQRRRARTGQLSAGPDLLDLLAAVGDQL